MNSDHSKPANADDQYLKYGDVILLEFDEGTSFLFSEGFQETQEVKTRVNDDIVNAEESSINNGGNLNYHLMFGGYGENFQSGLFEIVPTLQYENLKAFLKTYEDCVHYHFWEENHHHQFVIKPQVKRTLTTSQHEHFVDLLESTYIEFSTNEKEIQRKKGKPILYGKILNLRHVVSNKFLTLNLKSADTDHTSRKVVLQRFPQKGCGFQLLPSFKIKNEGDLVMASDKIVLKNLKSGYLSTIKPKDGEKSTFNIMKHVSQRSP